MRRFEIPERLIDQYFGRKNSSILNPSNSIRWRQLKPCSQTGELRLVCSKQSGDRITRCKYAPTITSELEVWSGDC